MDLSSPECLERVELYRGRWLTLSKVVFKNRRGGMETGEMVSRVKRSPSPCPAQWTDSRTRGCEGVTCILTLSSPGERYLVLISEYRYPVQGIVLSFIEGLVDPGDTGIEDSALREVQEETGIEASPIHVDRAVSPPRTVYVDSWKSDETSCAVIVNVPIGEKRAEDILGAQALEGEEDIRVEIFPGLGKKGFYQSVMDRCDLNGWTLTADVMAYLQGLEMANVIKGIK